MRLAERDEQLAELYDLLDRAARGGGGCALVTAGGGRGKTAVLGAVGARAARLGFLVLTASGSWEERHLPGGVLGQLLRTPGDAPLIPEEEIAGLLCRLGDLHEHPDELPPRAASRVHRLANAIVAAAEERPVLVCVDDVHHLDAASLHWLLTLVRVVGSARIALVMSECETLPTHSALRAQLLRQPDYRRVRLPELTEDGVAQMLGEHLDRLTVRRLAPQVHAVSRGIPLLVRALIEDLRNGAAPAVGVTVGPAFVDVALSLMERHEPGLLRTAQVLALVGGEEQAREVIPMLLDDLPPHRIDYYLAGLASVGFLDGTRLRHAPIRDAVLRTVPPRRAAELHLRTSELLYENGASAVAVSRHLVAAERVPAAWAVPVLRSAAEWLTSARRLAEAYECLDLALRACVHEPGRTELKLRLVRVAWLLNPALSRRHVADLVERLRAGRLPERHALPLARYLLWYGQVREAVDVLALAGGARDADPVASVEKRVSRELLFIAFPALGSGRPGSGRRERVPWPWDPAATDPRVAATAALSQVLEHGPDDEVIAGAQTAMRGMRLDEHSYVALRAAVAALLFADRLDDAGRWCDHWLDQAKEQGVPMWEGHFAALRAGISLRQGDLSWAAALAESALARVPAEGWGAVVAAPLAVLVHAATEAGDLREAAARLEVPVPRAAFQSRFGLHYLHARGRYHAETGSPHAALNDFTACGAAMRKWGFDHPSVVPWRTEAAHAHLLLGDRDKAAALARAQAAVILGDRPRARGMTLRVLAAATPDPAEGVSLLTEAVDSFRTCGDKLQLARALGDLGLAHRAAGHPARAQAVLRLAAGLAAECG
ncbi:AAA family ATPase, partial [Streptomyces capparidis]